MSCRACFTFAFLTTTVLSIAVASARIDVAPAPREVRSAGSGNRNPIPQTTPEEKKNSLEIVERIIQNSNAVGDKLAQTDTGMETRDKQGRILKDIQTLIEQQEQSPPSKMDQKQDSSESSKHDKTDKNNQGSSGDKKSGDTSDMNSSTQPMGGMNNVPRTDKSMDQTGDDPPKERQPRKTNGGASAHSNKSDDGQAPMPKKTTERMLPKNPLGAGGEMKEGLPEMRPSLQIQDDIMKDVWGHLPDKLRQQASQYSKQEFMPRYAELLKHYYLSLAEKGGKR